MIREELTNGKIILKKYSLSDVQPLFEAARESVIEVYRWLPWCHPNYRIEETSEWVINKITDWDNQHEFNFAIWDVEKKNIIGGCGINQINGLHKTGNLGYWVRSKNTGKGVATYAVKLCAEFGFTDLRLNRLEIIAAEGNIASQKVAEKAGAKKECLARNRLIIKDEIHNAYVYSLVKEYL